MSIRLSALQPHPDFPILEKFLLPHRHRALEGVDGVTAGVEGVTAMGGGDGDEDGRLTDLEATGAVQDCHPPHARPPRAYRLADLAHLDLGHRRVRLVLEILHGPAVRLVSHDT